MKRNKSKSKFLWLPVLAAIIGVPVIFMVGKGNSGPLVTVYKSPTCGCCKKWIAHLEDNGFNVRSVNKSNMTYVKAEHGVPGKLSSCHTAIVEGYTVEGHVPAEDIHRLLKDRPAVKGIAVPGMPIGSPGMEQGKYKDTYKVLTFTKEGKTDVYAYH